MTFRFAENASLPPLAWLASVEQDLCVVEHGRAVETQDTFLVEGVWNSEFVLGRFDQCETFFGSGIVEQDSEFILVSSSATVDYLYYGEAEGRLICSNSLPFLLAKLDDRLDAANDDLPRVNNSIMAGIESYERALPTAKGSVHRLMHHNLVVGHGKVRESPKPLLRQSGALQGRRHSILASTTTLPYRSLPRRVL